MRQIPARFISVLIALAFAAGLAATAHAQTTVKGADTITETTEPPPRTIIPEQKPKARTTTTPSSGRRKYTTPHRQPRHQATTTTSAAGYGQVKCDLPGGCEDTAVPAGAVTLEQFDAKRSGWTPPPAPQQYSEPAPAPAPVPPPAPVAPAPAPTVSQAAPPAAGAYGGGGAVESSKDKPIILRHYIKGVSEKYQRAPARVPSYRTQAAPAPAAPAAPVTPVAPVAPAAPTAPAVEPSPMTGGYKTDLPGYTPEPLPPGAVRLEDVTPPGGGYAPPPPAAAAPAPVDEFEEVRPPSMPGGDPDQPPTRWEQ